MKKYIMALWTLYFMSCGSETTSEYLTFSSFEQSKLKFKKGDCLGFKIDSLTHGVGVIFDFSMDERGIWYGLLLTDYESANKPNIDSIINGRFLGRKIQSSLNDKGFEIGLDTEYIIDSLLADNFSYIGNIQLNDRVKLGSQGTTSNMRGLIQTLINGKERRVSTPDDYHEHLSKSANFRPDEYFDIKDFIEK